MIARTEEMTIGTMLNLLIFLDKTKKCKEREGGRDIQFRYNGYFVKLRTYLVVSRKMFGNFGRSFQRSEFH